MPCENSIMPIKKTDWSTAIDRAQKAILEGKSLDDYDLPPSIIKKIKETHFTEQEINDAWAKACASIESKDD